MKDGTPVEYVLMCWGTYFVLNVSYPKGNCIFDLFDMLCMESLPGTKKQKKNFSSALYTVVKDMKEVGFSV